MKLTAFLLFNAIWLAGGLAQAAPTFSLHDLDGHTVGLGALRGMPVLLDFWATWCGYCREALPSIELLHRGLKGKLAVFGIDDEEPELARKYLQKYGYTLTLSHPGGKSLRRRTIPVVTQFRCSTGVGVVGEAEF
jgi:thiol-disulfide isomerase/thioredoxin